MVVYRFTSIGRSLSTCCRSLDWFELGPSRRSDSLHADNSKSVLVFDFVQVYFVTSLIESFVQSLTGSLTTRRSLLVCSRLLDCFELGEPLLWFGFRCLSEYICIINAFKDSLFASVTLTLFSREAIVLFKSFPSWFLPLIKIAKSSSSCLRFSLSL